MYGSGMRCVVVCVALPAAWGTGEWCKCGILCLCVCACGDGGERERERARESVCVCVCSFTDWNPRQTCSRQPIQALAPTPSDSNVEPHSHRSPPCPAAFIAILTTLSLTH